MTINSWGSEDPVQVSKGGTGVVTLASPQVILGSGTSPVTPAGAGTNGQLLIGSTGNDPAWATVSGTANEVSTATGAGSLTLSLSDNTIFPGTGSLKIPSGTTGQRPSPVNSMFRFNSTTGGFECVENGVWVALTTGVGGWEYLGQTIFSGISASGIVFNSTFLQLSAGYNFFFFMLQGMVQSAGGSPIVIEITDGSTTYTSGYYSHWFTPGPEGFTPQTAGLTLTTVEDEEWWGYFYISLPQSSTDLINYWGSITYIDSGAVNPNFVSGMFGTPLTTINQIEITRTDSTQFVDANIRVWGLIV